MFSCLILPPLSRAGREGPEDVVAGGSVVAGHVGQGEHVQAGGPAGGQVQPAALAQSGAAAAAGVPAGRLVAADLAAEDGEGRGGAGIRWPDREAVVEDPPAEAVAPVGPGPAGAADGLVARECAAADRESGPEEIGDP